MKRQNVAVILASGSGLRTGLDIPKQFYLLAGKTVLEHSLLTFELHPKIDEIVIVSKEEYFATIEEILSQNNIKKCLHILKGGAERYHSSLAAIDAYRDRLEVNFLIHDAVRPLVTEKIIDDCIKSLEHYQALSVAIPSDDTIFEVDKGTLKAIPERSRLWCAQTPQCFHLEILQKAYIKAQMDPNFQTTDDCKTVQQYMPEVQIGIVRGEKRNMKFTYLDDLKVLENFFESSN